MVERNFGWKRDLPDYRDLLYTVTRTAKLPDKVDLRDKCSKVEDQGELGSCTANAVVGALEYLLNVNGEEFEDKSRLYVYYFTREGERTIKYGDVGATNRGTIKAIKKMGACDEKLWKYDVKKFNTKPNPDCQAEGKKHVISSYFRLKTINQIKTALADGYPVIVGVTVYSGFLSSKVAKSGNVNLPTKRESEEGGHAILLVGYDESKQRFIFRNSWSTEWGNEGYGTIPYVYVRDMGDDFWIIKK